MSWQSIESAPKDSKRIKLKWEDGATAIGFWGYSPNAQIHAWCCVEPTGGAVLPYSDQAITEWTEADCSGAEFCAAMEKYCNIDEKYRGIHSAEPFDLEKGKPIGTLWIYYRTDKKDKGICFNFCPWCGADLKQYREPQPPERKE